MESDVPPLEVGKSAAIETQTAENSSALGAAWSALLAVAAARRAGQQCDLSAVNHPDLAALYGELARACGNPGYVLAHLGQSLDGCIAAASGHAQFVTGPANLVHLHRVRALADAIVVGGQTVAADNPQLTTRLVEGPSPVRVVLDRCARLSSDLRVFSDGAAPTLRVCASHVTVPSVGREDWIQVPEHDGELHLGAVIEQLARRGLPVLFVEGGGVTVSRFFERGLVDRLQIAVAPVLIGRGVPGISLPSVADMTQARRPQARRFLMGDDVLWDLDWRAAPSAISATANEAPACLDVVAARLPRRPEVQA